MKSDGAKHETDAEVLARVRPIAGGAGGTLTAEDTEQIVGAVTASMKPHVDGLAALTTEVAALRTENEGLKKLVRVEKEGEREQLFLNGQPFVFGKGAYAPPFVRSGSLGDKPILLSDYARMALAVNRGNDLAPFSRFRELSAKLLKFGHERDPNMMGMLMPITTNQDYFFTGTDEAEALCREIKQAAWSDPDPETTMDQLRWLAAKMATKGTGPQASDNDLLGGSLAGMPITGDIIPFLQATAVLGRAGARSMPLPPVGMRWPRVTSAPVLAYVAENGTIPYTDISTGVVNMSVKKAGGIIRVPNELLLMVNAAESFFRSTLVAAAALTEDQSGIDGIGAANTPKGILRYDRSANDTPTDGKVTLHEAATQGANGNTVGPLDPMSMITNLEEANYPDGATAFLMRPKMWQTLRTMRAGGFSATDGPFLFDPLRTMGNGPSKSIEGVPVITTTQIPKTMIKGTASNLTAIIAGDFSQVYLGRVGTVELAVSTEAGFREDQVHIRALYRHEVQIAEPRAFVVMPQLIA